MKVKIGTKLYNVTWTHFIGKNGKITSKVGDDETIKRDHTPVNTVDGEKELRLATVCNVFTEGNRYGLSVVHPKDRFDIEKGRKNSLTRAISGLSLRIRTEFWNKYFGKGK